MKLPRILALDLSLTGTGTAYWNGTQFVTRRIAVKYFAAKRLAAIRQQVEEQIQFADPQLAVIEDHVAHAKGDAYVSGELGGVIKLLLHDHGIPYMLVPPTSLKMFATGSGAAKKDEMIAHAIRYYGFIGSSNDEADALLLWHFAACKCGMEPAYRCSTAKEREKQVAALAKVDLPDGVMV